MSGGSRGIGLAIALRAARDGAGVAIIAKTEEPHPKLEGTIYSAAEAIRAAGGQALPIAGDVRDDDRVQAAIDQVVDHFGAIDICVNNASAIDLSPVESITMKRYDLMQDVNTRGTFVLTRACLPSCVTAATGSRSSFPPVWGSTTASTACDLSLRSALANGSELTPGCSASTRLRPTASSKSTRSRSK